MMHVSLYAVQVEGLNIWPNLSVSRKKGSNWDGGLVLFVRFELTHTR